MMPFAATDTPLNRFWGYVARGAQDECWLWNGPRLAFGHGHFKIGRTRVLAHRYSMELHSGAPIPAGKWVCHHCDNPPCVNPKHLYIGTQQDNMRDMWSRGRARVGRFPVGSRHPESRLTEVQVIEIRKRHSAGETQASLCRAFGITCGTMHSLVHRQTWRHV